MGRFGGRSAGRGLTSARFGGGGGGFRSRGYSGPTYRGSSGRTYSNASSYVFDPSTWDALQANIQKKLAEDDRRLKAETLQVYNDAEAAELRMADPYKRRHANADAAAGLLNGNVEEWRKK